MASTSKQAHDTAAVCAIVGQELQCAICHERVTAPRMLSCLHSFCEDCLKSAATHQGTALLCALCRSPTTLPENGVLGLKRDFRISRMVEALNELERHKRKLAAEVHLCDICIVNDKISAINYCQDCRQLLCEACSNVHDMLTSSRDHNIARLDDLISGKAKWKKLPLGDAERDNLHRLCSRHPGELLKLFCKKCRDPVCAYCVLLGPCKVHEVDVHMLDKCLPELSNEIALFIERLNTHHEQMEDVLSYIRNAKSSIEEKRSQLKANIQAITGEYIDIVSKNQQILSGKVDATVNKLLGELDSVKEESESSNAIAINGSKLASQLIDDEDVDAVDVANMYGNLHEVLTLTLSGDTKLKERISSISTNVQKYKIKGNQRPVANLVMECEMTSIVPTNSAYRIPSGSGVTTTAPPNAFQGFRVTTTAPINTTLGFGATTSAPPNAMRCLGAHASAPPNTMRFHMQNHVILCKDISSDTSIFKYNLKGSCYYINQAVNIIFDDIMSFALLSDSSLALIVQNEIYIVEPPEKKRNISSNLPIGRILSDIAVDKRDNIYIANSAQKGFHVMTAYGVDFQTFALQFEPLKIALSSGDAMVIAIEHAAPTGGMNLNVSLVNGSGTLLRNLSVDHEMHWRRVLVDFSEQSWFAFVTDLNERRAVIEFAKEGDLVNRSVCSVPDMSLPDLFAASNNTFAFMCDEDDEDEDGYEYDYDVVMISTSTNV